ncbi:MAG: hypothetical protein QN193_00755 [Armatimonadota bacterium]|nr:hypothetical protein [Armatimonadota bacterium]MDR7444901.1 hypothetical protein [Armatimonadota bacterium]MDR7569120.1 hypothetical protein [Armatimonadota bacterium]MDR7613434.1 hypothetical protein [Armatimonadota bacterium]
MQVRPVHSEPQPPGPASGPGFLHALERVRATGAVAPVSSPRGLRSEPSSELQSPPPTAQPPAFLDRLLGWLYQTVRGALGLLWSGLGELARWLRW